MKNQNSSASLFLWIDVDCFECQVWTFLHEELRNDPLIIVNHNELDQKIFSYDYRAKACGISRKDTIESAREKCPQLKLFPRSNYDELEHTKEKIELSIKKFIADELGNRIQLHMEGLEEGYLNIGHEVDLQISNGAKYFEENFWKSNTKWIIGNGDTETKNQDKNDMMRFQVSVNILAEILKRIELDTGLIASGSVGGTVVIARLACPLNKPQGITVVTDKGLEQLFRLARIEDVPGLKGQTGQKILDKWKKPDGTRLQTVQDFKEHVPFAELTDSGYVRKENKNVKDLMSYWVDFDAHKRCIVKKNKKTNNPVS